MKRKTRVNIAVSGLSRSFEVKQQTKHKLQPSETNTANTGLRILLLISGIRSLEKRIQRSLYAENFLEIHLFKVGILVVSVAYIYMPTHFIQSVLYAISETFPTRFRLIS